MASNTPFTPNGRWPSFLPPGKLEDRIEVDCYKGTKTLALACTQLPGKASRQKRIVNEWCDFFRKPSPVRQLILGTRLPIPLFEAICHQRELTVFSIKWGPIKDLSPIANLKKLKKLHLGSCSIEDLGPIAALTNLEYLSLSNLDRLSDYSPLAQLKNLQLLEIEGAPFMPKKVWIDDLRFMASLKKLHGLSICAARFRDSYYYKSLAGLARLEYLDLPAVDDATRKEIVSSLPRLKYGNVKSPSR